MCQLEDFDQHCQKNRKKYNFFCSFFREIRQISTCNVTILIKAPYMYANVMIQLLPPFGFSIQKGGLECPIPQIFILIKTFCTTIPGFH